MPSSKISLMSYRLGWVGTAAFQAFTDGGRELVFDLAENVSVPPECKEGDEVDIEVHPDHPANISMGMNAGYYEVTHLKSRKKFKVLHKTSDWRFDRLCQSCNLRIEKSGENFIWRMPGAKVAPTKLQNHHILRQAYETETCPLCSRQMQVVTT